MSWRRFFSRSTRDRDRADEIEAHLQHATAHYIEQGMTPDDARRKARLQFGNPRAHRERFDDMARLPIADVLGRDLRHALRMLARNKVFSATVIATLAVVIGANTAVFSIADKVLLKPLPYPQAERLAFLEINRKTAGDTAVDGALDCRIYETIRDQVGSLDIAVYSGLSNGVNFNLGDAAAFVKQARVSAGFFRVFGVAPQLGRELSREEDTPGGPKAAVISHALWQRVFAGNPSAIGQKIMLRGEPHEVVGVAPASFESPIEADVWTALQPARRGEGASLNYQGVARLRPGVTWTRVAADLRAISSLELLQSAGERPGQIDQWLSAGSLQDRLSAGQREPLLMLTAAVAAVLVIACINIASLFLARGGSRRKELATRMALGSGRIAVIRQLMVEAAVIALAGGAAGLVTGWLGLEALKQLGSDTFTDWKHVTIDARAIAMTAGLSILTSVLVGLVPAWQASRLNVQAGLVEGGSRNIAGGSRHWLRRALVVSQVALGVVLLVCAGLLIRTFTTLNRLDAGFDVNRVTTASVSLQDARYRTADRINQLFDRSLERLAATPGVESASVTLELPYTRLLNMGSLLIGDPKPHMVNMSYVSAGFTGTFGMKLVRGRDLLPSDRAGTAPVILVNEEFARLYSPDQDPIGRRLRVASAEREIVGVVRNVRQKQSFFTDGMVRGPITTAPAAFAPSSQLADGFFNLVHQWFRPVWSVRTSAPIDVSRAVRDAIAGVDPQLPVAEVQTMAQVKASSLAFQRLMMTLVAAIAAAALLLSALGLHGLIAHQVNERTREFGIRLALGATHAQTIRAVSLSGVVLSLVGAAIGGGLSVLAVRMVRSFLWGVEPTDPATYIGVMAFLTVVALTSSLLPAMKLLRLDPAKTLRD
jgi:predicted permease